MRNPKLGLRFPGKFIRFLSYSILCFLFLEGALRLPFFPSVKFRLDDKILHCMGENFLEGLFSDSIPWIRLCPNQDIVLYHPEKDSRYRVRTDSLGERISKETSDMQTYGQEVWILGDSVAMGYLVSDPETISWQIQSWADGNEKRFRIRNLGVDAVGSLGIRERLQEVVKVSSSPIAAYWIYHISDLTDSFREESLLSSWKKRILVRAVFTLSRYSALFNLSKILFEKWKPEAAENLVLPSENGILSLDHPHKKALLSLFDFTKENGIPLTLVFLPEPTKEYEPFVDSELVKEVRKIAQDSGIRVLDLQSPILELWEKERIPVFILKDGHPNPRLYRFISSELEKDLQKF